MSVPIVYSAIPTAFAQDGALDLASTTRVFEHAIAGGVDAIFVNGTTAEFPALSLSERRSLLQAAVAVAGVDRVVAHVGAASPYQTRVLTEDATRMGIRRLSVLTPFYMPGSLDGVRDQVRAATTSAPDAEIYLYLFPDRTGVRISAADAAEIVEDFDLAGAKISIAGTDYLSQMVAACRQPRTILSGNDGLMREVMSAGGAGIVSGVSSSLPALFVELAAAIGRADPTTIEDAASRINDVVPVLGPSIAGLKESLVAQGIIATAVCRMAIPLPDSALQREIARVVSTYSATADSQVA